MINSSEKEGGDRRTKLPGLGEVKFLDGFEEKNSLKRQ